MRSYPVVFIVILFAIIFGVGYSISTIESTIEDELKNRPIVIKVAADKTIQPTTNTPQSPDGPDSHFFYSEPFTLEQDVIITGFDLAMEGADISVLHHTLIGVTNREPNICNRPFTQDSSVYEIYTASRNTLDPVRFPAPYGIHLNAGETLFVEFMTHPQATPHGMHAADEDLSPTLVVTLHTNENHTTPIEFTRLRLDDSPCKLPLVHQAFSVPTSSDSTTFTKTSADNKATSETFFASTSTIIVSGANFWPRKGGQSIDVLLNDEIVKSYTAEQGDTAINWNIPYSSDTITIPASSTISIQANYINPYDTPIKDASGMFGFWHTIN